MKRFLGGLLPRTLPPVAARIPHTSTLHDATRHASTCTLLMAVRDDAPAPAVRCMHAGGAGVMGWQAAEGVVVDDGPAPHHKATDSEDFAARFHTRCADVWCVVW